ncbi:isopeptide-forming domain-containing fimbrial protein [Finegoldia magna]|uniref:isopeptide-forming domain-containing fimbrial protein n=1 Tax=Finegoldia magna TaxID=1260 RepID=UPI00290705B3|nr:isopeptide-forming domain-containing fimbrial protein [Finegoldia magna]MDU7165088.1 pilin N-terminal domain-containing protein [Finegoldia magna]
MKKRFLSLMLALAMVVGVFTPLIASAEGESTEKDAKTETVTLHKILMDKENLNIIGKRVTVNTAEAGQPENKVTKLVTEKTVKEKGNDVKKYYVNGVETAETDKFVAQYIKEGGSKLFKGQIGIDNTDYNGNALTIESYFGNGSKDIGGVYFAWAKKDTDGKYYWIKTDGNFTDTKTEVKENELAKLPDDTFGGKTEADKGIKFSTSSFKGEYKIYEIHEKSTYKGENGKTLTDMKAVPVEITLPLVNEKGTVINAHVYPKNTEDKPDIDKNFKKADTSKNEKELEKAEGFTEAADGAGIGVGAKYENKDKTKATAKAYVGKVIPYEVKTKIPAKSKLATAYWTDEMTEGLTFNKDSLKIKIGGQEAEGKDYTIDKNDFGFTLRLTKDGLAKINNKDADVEVELTYSATVNSKAIPDQTDKNKVVFNYGNNPSKGTTPKSNKPNDNGELKVTKTWDDGTWATGEKATFKLVDKDGKLVTADDLVRPKDMTDENWNKAKAEFKNEVEIGYNKNGGSYTWKYLDKSKEYKAVEVKITTGTEAEYIVDNVGEIKVKNYKSDNPTPLEPTSPEVVTGGRRFVKTNNEEKGSDKLERLAGAEFYVKNSENKYLVAAKKDASKVTAAKEALDAKVKAYNELTADQQKGKEGEKAKKDIDDAQDAYNKAFKDNATAYTWGDKKDAVVLTSDGQGRFEITGLEYGSYKLEEKTAPKDYATISEQEFTVEKGSYAGKNTELQYNKDNADKGYGLQIKNKKVTIPQTGGIGTIIFTAIGLAIMASAVIAIKKRQATEAR